MRTSFLEISFQRYSKYYWSLYFVCRNRNRKGREFERETADEEEESSTQKKKNCQGKITNSILHVYNGQKIRMLLIALKTVKSLTANWGSISEGYYKKAILICGTSSPYLSIANKPQITLVLLLLLCNHCFSFKASNWSGIEKQSSKITSAYGIGGSARLHLFHKVTQVINL